MTKFASLKKNPHEKYHRGKKFRVEQKHAPTCPGLFRHGFQSLYHTSFISPKREIDDTVNFRNFRKSFTNKFCGVLCGILAPHFQWGKMRRSDRAHEAAHEACCNGRHLYIGEVNVATMKNKQ